jgi:hypothetical protein
MSPQGRAYLELLLLFLILTLISLGYVMWTWPTSPMEIIDNLDQIGPSAFLLDLLFFGVLYRIWRKARITETENNIWE